MQSDDVALAQQDFKAREPRLRDDVISQHLQAKSFSNLGYRLADCAIADNADRRAAHVANRMIKEAELIAGLPAPGTHIVAIGDKIAPKRKGQGEDMFWYRVEGVIPYVRNDNSARLAVGFVDNIGARCRDRNQLKIGELSERYFAHWNFVDDGDCRTPQPIQNLIYRSYCVFPVAVGKIRRTQLGL